MTALPTPFVALLAFLAALGLGAVLVSFVAAVLVALQLRGLAEHDAAAERALADLYAVAGGGFGVLEARMDEAVGRLTVLTADHVGGYETETFARRWRHLRERLESATIGVENARWN